MLKDGSYQPRTIIDEVRPNFVDNVLISLNEVW